MKTLVRMKSRCELFTILAVSFVLVLTAVPAQANGPALEVYKWVDPGEIFHRDCQIAPNYTTVTCSLYGGGTCEEVGLPIDVMLVLDRSGSMLGTPLDSVKIAANMFVDLLRSFDDAGLVSFGGNVRLNVDVRTMTPFGKNMMHSQINNLSSVGSTPLGDAIDLANARLARGEAPGGQYEVLITDGDPMTFTGSTDPIDAAHDAAVAGITIFVIGLSVDKPEQKELLRDVADITGGEFYEPEFPDVLVSIFEDISTQIICTIGKDIVVTETVQSYLNVLGGFTKPPHNSYLNCS